MRLRKLTALLAVIPFLLSCSTQSIAGSYGFQLGKEAGTHFGLYVDLFDSTYVPQEGETLPEKDLKDMNFRFSVDMGPATAGDSSWMSDIMPIIDKFDKDSEGFSIIPGYYKLTDEVNKNGEQRIKVGLEYSYVFGKVKDYIEEQTGEPMEYDPETFNQLNNSALIQSILYLTYADQNLNIYVPVSIEDLYYQLFWYGFDVQVSINTSEEIPFDIQVVEVPAHEFGTVPTAEELETIKAAFAESHKNMLITEFRMFNALKIQLAKK